MAERYERPANGKLLEGVYSFVEDFGRNGGRDGVEASDRTPFQRRAADFMNPWFKNEEGEWEPARQAKFTEWSENQPLTNITAATLPPEAGKSSVVFRLETGGHVVQQAQLNSTINSKATPSSPPSVPK